MRILMILGSLIVGTVAGIYMFATIWHRTAPESAMAMTVGGGTPIVFGVLAYLGTKSADGQRPNLGSAKTWLAILGIAAAAAGLFLVLIVAGALLVQRG
ncbi:hypothetical protein [Sinorhizobium sp. RAC02]|uniref:hypothetical protein n=1 Tax=Sinorhizobium sp. RAC02 TaxID=1842534 RepID=UPI00083D50F5|nr:hypothetical protein [Sinorhizobium sp. RAC02]AOF93576.1 putative membrane protein [Sinorhizobium sp. RAC02]